MRPTEQPSLMPDSRASGRATLASSIWRCLTKAAVGKGCQSSATGAVIPHAKGNRAGNCARTGQSRWSEVSDPGRADALCSLAKGQRRKHWPNLTPDRRCSPRKSIRATARLSHHHDCQQAGNSSYLHPARDAPISRISMSDGLSGGRLYCERRTVIDVPVWLATVPRHQLQTKATPSEASSCLRLDTRLATAPSPRWPTDWQRQADFLRRRLATQIATAEKTLVQT